MSENLHVGTHKTSHPNYDMVFGVKYKFEVCRTCSTAKANSGDGKCNCSLVEKD